MQPKIRVNTDYKTSVKTLKLKSHKLDTQLKVSENRPASSIHQAR